MKYFNELLNYQYRSYCIDQRIRIDFNLKNFVINDGKLYLVDIMPPIFIDQTVVDKGKKCNKKVSQLVTLYMNIDHQIVGMIGYWLLDSIEYFASKEEPSRRKLISKILNEFIKYGNQQ